MITLLRSLRIPPLLVLLVLLATAHPVTAGVLWCKSDPIISLNGTLVDVTVDIPLDKVPLVIGPVAYTIQTPASVVRSVVLSDPGFNAKGITVRFTNRDGGIDGKRMLTTVKVTVPLDKTQLSAGTTVPARLTVFPHNGTPVVVEGTTDLTRVTLWITGQ